MKSSLVNPDAAKFESIREGQRPIDIAFLFRVRAEGSVIGDFQAVEGFQRTVEIFEYQEGGRNTGQHVLPGPVKHGRLILKGGIMVQSYLYDWIRAVEVGGSCRREVLISQLTRQGKPIRMFTVERAWPCEWKAPALDASQSQVPIEELTLAYDELRMEVNADAS